MKIRKGVDSVLAPLRFLGWLLSQPWRFFQWLEDDHPACLYGAFGSAVVLTCCTVLAGSNPPLALVVSAVVLLVLTMAAPSAAWILALVGFALNSIWVSLASDKEVRRVEGRR